MTDKTWGASVARAMADGLRAAAPAVAAAALPVPTPDEPSDDDRDIKTADQGGAEEK